MQRRENLRRSADELRKGLGETRQTLSEALIELEQMLSAEKRRQEGLALNEVRDNAET